MGDILSYKDEDILKIVKEHIQGAEHDYSKRYLRMKENWKRYKLIPINDPGTPKVNKQQDQDQPPQAGRANLQYPWIRIICDAAVSTLLSGVRPDPYEWLTTECDNADVTRDQLELAKSYMLSRCSAHRNQINLFRKLKLFMLYGMIFDWTAISVNYLDMAGWTRETPTADMINDETKENPELWDELLKRIRQSKAPKTDDLNEGFKFVEHLIQRPDVDVPHPMNCVPDSCGGADRDTWAFFGVYGRMLWGNLKNSAVSRSNPYGQYYNIPELEKLIKSGGANAQTEYDKAKQEVEKDPDTIKDVGLPEIKKKNEIADSTPLLLLTYYTKDALIVCDHSFKVVVRKQRNNRIPVSTWSYSKDSDTVHGDPLVLLLDPFVEELNHLANSNMDNLNFAINAMTVINKAMMPPAMRTKKHMSYPGKIWVIDSATRPASDFMDVVKIPYVTQDVDRQADRIQNLMERIASVGNTEQGVQRAAGERTAYETELVRQGSSNRWNDQGAEIEYVITDVLDMIAELDLHYMSEIKIQKYMGDYAGHWVTIGRELFLQFAPFIKYTPQGSQFMRDRTQAGAFLMNIIKTATMIPQLNQILNYPTIFKRVVRLSGEIDPARYINQAGKNMYTRPIEEEHQMMANGIKVMPGYLDDDEEHMMEHTQEFQKATEGQSEYVPKGHAALGYVALLMEHIEAQNMQRQEKLAPAQSPSMPNNEQPAGPGKALGATTPAGQGSQIINPNAAVPA